MQQPIAYQTLRDVMNRSLEIYTSVEGTNLILERRRGLIEQLISLADDKIIAILSSGYPNYVLTPSFSNGSLEELTLQGDFTPVPEIVTYHERTLARIDGHQSNETWPCIDHYVEAELQTLRPKECTTCDITSLGPFFAYTTIPDMDLYIVVKDRDSAQAVLDLSKQKGVYCAEKDLAGFLLDFPERLPADFHFALSDDFNDGLERITDANGNWTEVAIPVYHNHGKLVNGKMTGFGLDFAFSLTPHWFSNDELADAYNRARQHFVMAQGIDLIVSQLQNTRDHPTLSRRIGRLATNYPSVELDLRNRLQSFRTIGPNSSIDRGYLIVQNPNPDALFELFEFLAQRNDSPVVVDKALLPLLGKYAPSFVADINSKLGTSYPIEEGNYGLEQASQLAMAHNALDNILFEGRATKESLEDRLLRLKSVAQFFGEDVTQISQYLEKMEEVPVAEGFFFAKDFALGLYEHVTSTPNMMRTLLQSSNDYPFIGGIIDLFGSNLQNVILYGSSTEKKNGNDYDLLVVVDEVSLDMYRSIENKQRELNAKCDKDVHLIVVPKERLTDYLSFDTLPVDEMELLYGESIEMPVFEDTGQQYATSIANKIVRTLTGVVSTFKDPDRYRGKPEVLFGHVKLPKHLIDVLGSEFSLPQTLVRELHGQYQQPPFTSTLSTEQIKLLRSQAVHNLFTIPYSVN